MSVIKMIFLIKTMYETKNKTSLLFAFKVLHKRHDSYLWHSGHATNKQDLIDIRDLDVSVLDSFLTWFHCLLDEWTDNLLQLSSSQFVVHVLWSTSSHSQVW